VANGGRLVRPHVVQELIGASGSSVAPERNFASSQVLGETVREELVKILEGVVDRGTGAAIALPGYAIAGKTGTAQKFEMATGRYSKTASVSTFVGFVPAEAPVFVAAVMLDEPQGQDLGGWTSGPVFRSVMSSALAAYGVPPDDKIRDAQEASAKIAVAGGDWSAMYKRGAKAETVREVDVPNLKGLTEQAARIALARAGLRVRVLGRGRVGAQFPSKGSSVLENSTVTLSLRAADSEAPPEAAASGPGKSLWGRVWSHL
jgi:membrane peptidoglycan carboxypeptidase